MFSSKSSKQTHEKMDFIHSIICFQTGCFEIVLDTSNLMGPSEKV